LFTVNGLSLVIYLVLLSRLLERLGTTDWGRLYVLAAGCLGTFLLPFSVTLNNHVPAACSALFAVVGVRHIWTSRALLAAGGAAVPAALFLGTNYLAIGQLRPAYSELGGPWYQYEDSYWQPAKPGQEKRGIDWAHESKATYTFHWLLGHHGFFSLSPVFLLAV